MVYGSVIVILVFMPVFLLEGLAGSFFRPLALSYMLAILASLLVALIVTPALSLMLLPRHTARTRGAGRQRASSAVPADPAGPDRRAERAPSRSSRSSLAATAAAFPLLGEEFLPHFQETRLPDALGREARHVARGDAPHHGRARAGSCWTIPGVRNFGAHIGRAEVADEVVGINFTELWISLDPAVDYDATVAQIQEPSSTAIPACTATC